MIHSLTILGFKINIVGDKLNIHNVINYGHINNNELSKLQARAKYTIASNENIYSLFTLECIAQNVKILVNKSDKLKIKFYKDSFLKINFKNIVEFNKVNY